MSFQYQFVELENITNPASVITIKYNPKTFQSRFVILSKEIFSRSKKDKNRKNPNHKNCSSTYYNEAV